MSDNYEFQFDKFIKDIEKRETKVSENMTVTKLSLEEEEMKRKRELLYRERWQNRITWGENQ
jgi:hypothetical protein